VLWRYPHIARDFLVAGSGQCLVMLALFLLFERGRPGECGLEHSCRAYVAIAAPSLVAQSGSTTSMRAHTRTIKKYDSGYGEFFADVENMPEPFRFGGSGTRKCA
jgi:hypothetical protein